jgi:Uncharacterised protein family (UPF0182)
MTKHISDREHAAVELPGAHRLSGDDRNARIARFKGALPFRTLKDGAAFETTFVASGRRKRGFLGPDRRDLPARLPRALQAIGGHAPRAAAACSLPRGPVIYRAYHMKSAEVFYNREDLWQFPRQPTGGDEATMAPYYIIARLPGEPQADYSHR